MPVSWLGAPGKGKSCSFCSNGEPHPDPPIFQNYRGRGIEEAPGETGWKTHSPLFGIGLKRRLDEMGVENYLTYDGKPAKKYGNPVEFFIAKLKKE